MKNIFIILLLNFILYNSLYAWDSRETHPAITDDSIEESVIDNYLKTQMGLTEGTATQLYWDFPQDVKKRIDKGDANPEQTIRTISQWLRVGSIIEDRDEKFIPWRPRHHFHDPTRNAGLDNHADHPDWNAPLLSPWLPLGQSALTWAIDGFALEEPQNNNENWSDARATFYESLTSPDKSTRESRLAETMLKLGCVIHLLEDMGVPAHTRNDFLFGHYRSIYKWDWGNPLETWVGEQIEANGGQCLWSGSGPVVFDKLADYFDTDEYGGSYLGDGQVPPNTWGLSECSNYQFFSLSTMFGCSGVLYQFPHPAREHIEPNIIVPVTEGYKIYFNGSNYSVPHIARYSYTYYKAKLLGYNDVEIDSTNTTDDVRVFNDYADVTIPRTIDYTTGLINYFFRGRLSVEPNCLDGNDVQLIITNDSQNSGVPQTLKGGTFELYWEDENGQRTKITDFTVNGWNSGSTLGYGQSVTGEFTCIEEGIHDYILVYKGTISENPAVLDPDDSDAIALCKVEIPENCCVEMIPSECYYCDTEQPASLWAVLRNFSDCPCTVYSWGSYSAEGDGLAAALQPDGDVEDPYGSYQIPHSSDCIYQHIFSDSWGNTNAWYNPTCNGVPDVSFDWTLLRITITLTATGIDVLVEGGVVEEGKYFYETIFGGSITYTGDDECGNTSNFATNTTVPGCMWENGTSHFRPCGSSGKAYVSFYEP